MTGLRHPRLLAEHVLNGLGEFPRRKAEWPCGALIGDAPARVDQVQPVRPRRIRPFDRVVRTVDERRGLDTQAQHAGACDAETLLGRLRPRDKEAITDILSRLPEIDRMGFFDVDDVERNTIAIAPKEVVDGGHRPPKGWSRIAAKDERNGALPAKRRQPDRFRAVQERQ